MSVALEERRIALEGRRTRERLRRYLYLLRTAQRGGGTESTDLDQSGNTHFDRSTTRQPSKSRAKEGGMIHRKCAAVPLTDKVFCRRNLCREAVRKPSLSQGTVMLAPQRLVPRINAVEVEWHKPRGGITCAHSTLAIVESCDCAPLCECGLVDGATSSSASSRSFSVEPIHSTKNRLVVRRARGSKSGRGEVLTACERGDQPDLARQLELQLRVPAIRPSRVECLGMVDAKATFLSEQCSYRRRWY